MSSLKVGALSDAEIATHLQNLQTEQSRRAKMRQEAQSFLAGSPGRLAVLTSVIGPMPAASNGNGNGQHKATPAKPAKTVKVKTAKAPVKIKIRYRDPARPENTWSGRGRPARWITEAIQAGKAKSKDEFLVQA